MIYILILLGVWGSTMYNPTAIIAMFSLYLFHMILSHLQVAYLQYKIETHQKYKPILAFSIFTFNKNAKAGFKKANYNQPRG